ncbi:putative peptidoglycan lipid II flippase [Anaerobranca californiensis DSM 14826]|jgi:putative peptidoglycan lipid II flippase|uniref:Probable lipid II flippase MurJ n=1 Tax=Anaerobranca californiensis DSM 14826 TaxID=1120989 RepID=A0A1M6K641_9FIRM|nr:murein biosynthesis integral membrane protein MurJ [Anaerobranca californiensis]SHJ54388.1 putative peptidoglycan lipid II flippase [Anaerobranca californiensis DSM 14826]
MKKTALLLMILSILSKILGFTREITLSYFYGASNISDAYLISVTIPTVIFAFVGTALATSYIPMFNNISKNEGNKKAYDFSNNIINFLLIISTFIVILGLFFTESVVKLFASGFEGETLNLAVTFTTISIFGVYFTGLTYIFNSYLQIKNNFLIPAIVGFPFNIIIILSIYISSKGNIIILSLGMLLAIASQLIFLLPFSFKKGYRYNWVLNKKDPYLKQMIYLSIPVILGTSVNQINALVDRTIASRIAEGGISALNYANRLNGFVEGIFVISIATVMYPMISKMAAENNFKGLKRTLSEAINLVNILVIPATLGAMIFAEPVVRLLFGRGAFNERAIAMTSFALFFYSIGLIGKGLRLIISRAFYSMQDTKTPMINAAIGMVLNIILNIILSKYLGIGGLALATSIAAIFTTILLFISLRKKIGPFGMKSIVTSFVKILAASLVMGAIAKLSYNTLLQVVGSNLALILAIGVGAGIYFILIYFMKIPEVDTMVMAVKKKLKFI